MIQIPINTKIDESLYIDHCGHVVVNEGIVLGKNINLVTGVTIEQYNRGKHKGTQIMFGLESM